MSSSNFSVLVKAQRQFFNSNKTKDAEFCRAQLQKLRKIVEENRQNIYDAVYRDLRRNSEITNMIEMNSILGELDYTLENLGKLRRPKKLPEHPLGELFIYKEPLGVVLIIGAFNFQLVLALRPAISALASGNTVIVKTSEHAPNTSKLLVDMIEPNFPRELFAIVEGDGPVAERLLKERFDHIFYTGSAHIGRLVMIAAAEHLTPVTLELGGRNAALIEEDADLNLVANNVARNKWINCGQVCLSPDYILINTKLIDKFLQELKTAIEDEYGKTPKKSPKYSRIVNEQHFRRLESYISNVRGEIVYKSLDENDINDLFIGPHVVRMDKKDLPNHEEIFGPVLLIVGISSFDEAIQIVNSNEKCLSLYMFTDNQEKINRVVKETSSGALTINDMVKHFAAPVPFGGVGKSGMGSYHWKYGFDTFIHKKAVLKAKMR